MVRKLNESSPSPTAGAERQRRRADERRRNILRAAGRAFRRRGVAATGMREIAAEADLSPANLYHYFAGKDEILFYCQDRALARMLEALAAARDGDGPVAARLAAVIRAHARCLLDEVDGASAHLETEGLRDELRERLVAGRDRYERGVRALVAAGVEAGEFAPCDPTLVTRAMLGAINWTARWFRPEGRHSAGEVADTFAAYLVRGLAASPHGGDR